MSLLTEFGHNVIHNLFKPLLLFFYMGFLIPIFGVSFEFPYVIYQGLTIYLLIAIGWHGGEELASLSFDSFQQALGFMAIGFFTNFIIGILAYQLLRRFTPLRKIDAATVAGYYGSDSAGTFVTCIGVLTATGIAYAAYMPVMLAIMEIPGCLVALYLVSRLRSKGLDAHGNAWDEEAYDPTAVREEGAYQTSASHGHIQEAKAVRQTRLAAVTTGGSYGNGNGNGSTTAVAVAELETTEYRLGDGDGGESDSESDEHQREIEREAEMALEKMEGTTVREGHPTAGAIFSKELLHEVFLNPGIYLLFGGIAVGFISRLQGEHVTKVDDHLFVTLFQGLLCLFLLEMGITASRRLLDLKKAGWQFVGFGLLAPNLFAAIGMTVAHLYSHAIGTPLDLGTYVLFAVLCGAASYIAVPAVQRLAIPEASPTLPLAASLGLTFSYNVTIGIPVYILLAQVMIQQWPVT